MLQAVVGEIVTLVILLAAALQAHTLLMNITPMACCFNCILCTEAYGSNNGVLLEPILQ